MAAGVTPRQSDITKSNCLSCAVLFHVSHKSPGVIHFKLSRGRPRSPHPSCKEKDNWTTLLLSGVTEMWRETAGGDGMTLNLNTACERCCCLWSVYTVVRGLGVTPFPATHFLRQSLVFKRTHGGGGPKEVGDFSSSPLTFRNIYHFLLLPAVTKTSRGSWS